MTRVKTLTAAAALLALIASALVTLTTTASAAPPAGAEGSAVLSPAVGDSDTTFTITPDTSGSGGGNPACNGDNPGGYAWSGFIAPQTVDPSTITVGVNGPNAPAIPLVASGVPMGGLPTLSPDNFVLGIPSFDFSLANALGITPGDYYIGIVCTLNNSSDTYWADEVTVIADAVNGGSQGLIFQQGAPAVSPTLLPFLSGASSVTETSVIADFTPGASDPADLSYEVTASDGVNTFTATGATPPIEVTGLTVGITYDVSVTATNAVGTSAPSNVEQFTTARPPRLPVQALACVPGAGAGDLEISFNAPSDAGSAAPLSYDVVVEDASLTPFAGSPFSVPAGADPLTLSLAGAPAGVLYDVTVSAVYADVNDTATPAATSCAAQAAQVLNQEITVERPAGALILTQRCGVANDIPAFTAVDAFPGYPFDLGAEAATADQVGTSPDADLVTAGQQDDPEFGLYPFPTNPTYPTQCGLALGTAAFVTSGALAGQFYAADGVLNEVTVVDTRDVDAGWTVQGTMGTLAAGSSTFAGNYLGWEPVMTDDSDAVVVGGYDQVVTAGPAVLPGSGINAGTGLGDGQVLATALAGEGLGIATLDARIQLLIPTSVPAGSYTGILALTVI